MADIVGGSMAEDAGIAQARAVLDALLRGASTAPEVAEHLAIARTTAGRLLRRLVEAGVIVAARRQRTPAEGHGGERLAYRVADDVLAERR